MDIDNHIPSLTHLREFVRARASSRTTHVAQDRLQVEAPSENRMFAFAYERFLTAVIDFVGDGNRGSALERAAAGASDRMRHSYEECAKGMTRLLGSLKPSAARRRQRNVVVSASDGYELASLRLHLVFELQSGTVAAFMHFPAQPLAEAEIAIVETAVALASAQISADATPAIVFARTGVLRLVDSAAALAPSRVAFLRSGSIAYRRAWSEAA
jgi:hypothetical protein